MVERSTRYLAEHEINALRQVSTATLTTQLFHRGIKTAFMNAVRPLRPELRLVGYAYTLRYIPAREDLGASADFDNTTNPQRIAVEDVGPEDVLVIDARGQTQAGTLGDILITRMKQRGVAGIVTDGSFRDSPAIRSIDVPTYAASSHGYMSSILHHPADTNLPIACAGVAVIPGDVVVGDAEGVVVIPRQIAAEVARDALEQERYEDWATTEIESGSSIHGIYPPNEETLARYQAERERS